MDEPISGTKFYVAKGMKTVTIHLPGKVHAFYVNYAERQDRSLQKTLRRLLVTLAENPKLLSNLTKLLRNDLSL